VALLMNSCARFISSADHRDTSGGAHCQAA
jgi:hypothetical protein